MTYNTHRGEPMETVDAILWRDIISEHDLIGLDLEHEVGGLRHRGPIEDIIPVDGGFILRRAWCRQTNAVNYDGWRHSDYGLDFFVGDPKTPIMSTEDHYLVFRTELGRRGMITTGNLEKDGSTIRYRKEPTTFKIPTWIAKLLKLVGF